MTVQPPGVTKGSPTMVLTSTISLSSDMVVFKMVSIGCIFFTVSFFIIYADNVCKSGGNYTIQSERKEIFPISKIWADANAGIFYLFFKKQAEQLQKIVEKAAE